MFSYSSIKLRRYDLIWLLLVWGFSVCIAISLILLLSDHFLMGVFSSDPGLVSLSRKQNYLILD